MSTTNDPRPNILLLHTDQQRFDTIAALGAGHMRTPNIDRLVKRGTSFTRSYSSCPVCQPARHDLITGVSARHHGYFGNRPGPIADYGLPTLPRMLTAAGYQTLAVGKMHFYPERTHLGFAHMYLMEELPECREDDAYLCYLEEQGYGSVRCQHGVRPLVYHTPQVTRIPEEHHGSAWVATKTIELLNVRRHRPFFLFASWVGPHPPYYVPQHYLDEYRGADVPLPSPPTESSRLHAPESPENPARDSLRMKLMQESYYAAITFIDVQIGRILDELDRLGMAGNTTILFTTDHGEMLGDLGAYQKHIPYEGSAHIPLIAVGSGIAEGAVCETPATTWDTAATILEVAGVTPPDGHQLVGESLRTLAANSAERTVNYHHGSGARRYVAATDGRYKFIHWYSGGHEELYDVITDRGEQHNLIGAPEQSARCAALRASCIEFEAAHGQGDLVAGGRFNDLEYAAPAPHSCSLYPEWSNRQLPPWPEVHSAEDRSAIVDEAKAVLSGAEAYICTEPEWRQMAVREWEAIGGNPKEYEKLFEIADRGRS